MASCPTRSESRPTRTLPPTAHLRETLPSHAPRCTCIDVYPDRGAVLFGRFSAHYYNKASRYEEGLLRVLWHGHGLRSPGRSRHEVDN
jgi:hypothetical protein